MRVVRRRSEGWMIVRVRAVRAVRGGGGELELELMEMISWDWARDCVFSFLGCWRRGEARRLRAGALAFLMGEVLVRCFDWERVNGFALAAWERVEVAIVFGAVFGGGKGVVGEVGRTVIRESGGGRKLPAAERVVD